MLAAFFHLDIHQSIVCLLEELLRIGDGVAHVGLRTVGQVPAVRRGDWMVRLIFARVVAHVVFPSRQGPPPAFAGAGPVSVTPSRHDSVPSGGPGLAAAADVAAMAYPCRSATRKAVGLAAVPPPRLYARPGRREKGEASSPLP